MFFTSLLIFCSLLQVDSEVVVPKQSEQRLPIPRSTRQPVQELELPAAHQVDSPQMDPNQLYFQNGFLELPKYNHILLPAPERAVLVSLRTEQRDAAGNALRDNNGEPIMVHVKEGMYVYEGQVLGNFYDRELHTILKINEAKLEVAISERDKQIEVDYALYGVQVADYEVKTMEEANERVPKTFPIIEVLRAKETLKQAWANYDLQKYNINEVKAKEVIVQEKELDRTKEQIDLRKLIAPIDGMIVKIEAAEGEWKREGDPVLEIIQLDTMRVRVMVDPKQYAIHELDGKRATIQVPLARGKMETFQGTVVFCDPTIGGNKMYYAYIEVPNRKVGNYWILQPGQDGVGIVIHL
jgi:multidrug efflux pump subunit AcrA (membrane-fusion protein)